MSVSCILQGRDTESIKLENGKFIQNFEDITQDVQNTVGVAKHASTHAIGGDDLLSPNDIGAVEESEVGNLYLWEKSDSKGNIEYVTDSDATAYPESGELNGYTYELKGKIGELGNSGDYYTKEESLSDETAALYGLDKTAVPDDVLVELGRFQSELLNDYAWKKKKTTRISNATWTTGTNQVVGTWSSSTIWYYSDRVIFGSNVAILDNPQKFQFPSAVDVSKLNVLKGKYVIFTGKPSIADTGGGVLFIPEDAVFTINNGSIYCSSVNTISQKIPDTVEETYVYLNAKDAEKYPPAADDGWTYDALGQIGAAARIVTGSYVGTGAYGEAAPMSITFPAPPKLVIVYQAALGFSINGSSSGWYGSFIWTPNVSRQSVYVLNGTSICFAQDGNTLRWSTPTTSADSSGLNSLNAAGQTYYYFALV